MNYRLALSLASGLLLSSSISMNSRAQSNGPEPLESEFDQLLNMSLEDLINFKVSIASSRERDERSVFGSVHKMDASEWDASSGRLIFDALDVLPGVDTQHSLGGTRMVSIRGYSHTTQSARGKAVLFDGVPVNGFAFGSALYSKSTLPANIVSSLELVKGPSSAFYGPDAFHGAIQLNPWGGADLKQSVFSLSAGTRQDYEANARSSYGIHANVSGSTNINVIKQFDAALEAPNLGQEFKNYIQAYTINQNIYSDIGQFSLLYHDAETDDFHQMFQGKGDFARIDSAETLLLYYKHDIKLADQWRLLPYVWAHDSDFALYEDFNALEPDPGQYETWHDRQYGAKAHLDWMFSDRQEYTFGTELIHSKDVKSQSYRGAQPPTENEHSDHQKNIYAVFIDYRATLIPDTLLLNLGLRYDYFSNSKVGENSPKLGLIWLLNDENSLKFIYSEGYRAPASGEYYGAGAWLGNEELNGERLKSLEVIHQYISNNFKWTNSAYSNDWQDGIITLPTELALEAGKSGEYLNQGENNAIGFETDANYLYEPLSTLFYINGSYNYAKNETLNTLYDMYPRFKASLGGRYEKEQWKLDVRHIAKFNRKEGRLPGAEKLKDWHELNVSLGYAINNITITAAVFNLLDHENIEPSIWFVDGGIYANGREFRLSTSYTIQ
ncbi:TonB-dependent receptor plug domain-containing protein [Agaribacterium sp. ZY112]|uniref:TonB-dependent receptor plug domain-containing protein n=1 Tax=Agaribacterium sp. ZY112 TaxID=3233574 RepID=UPI0035268D30